MAGRVNTKFVIILCVVLIVGVVGVVVLGTGYMSMRRSAEYFEKRGDELLAQGEHKRASEAYLRGIGREKDNVTLLNKYIDLAEDLPMATTVEASNTLGRIRTALRQAAQYRQDDADQLDAWLSFEKEIADLRGATADAYAPLFTASDDWLTDRPGNLVAKKYRGIAQTVRMSPDMPADEVAQIEADLTAAYDADATDAEVLHHLAMLKLKQAMVADRAAGQAERAKQLREEGYQVSLANLSHDRTSLDRLTKHLMILVNRDVQRLDEARGLLDELEASALNSTPTFSQVNAAGAFLAMLDTEPAAQGDGLPDATRGRLRALAIYEKAAADQPNDVTLMVILGTHLRSLGRLDGAMAQFDKVLATDTQGNALETLSADFRRQQAAYQVGETAVALARTATGEQRQQLLERADQAAEELEKVGGSTSGQLFKLRGKIHMVRGRFDDALQDFERANERFTDNDTETLLLIADAANRTGNWGLAVEKLQSILGRRPGLVPLRVNLAKLLLERRQTDDAEEQINTIAAAEPDHPELPQLRAGLLNLTGQHVNAIDILEAYDLNEHPEMVGPLVRAYLAEGRTEDARKLIVDRFASNPGDVNLLQLALRVTPDDEGQLALIEQARAAGTDENLLDLLERNVSGQLRIEDVIEMQAQRGGDPLDQALNEARIYLQARQGDKAIEAIKRAAEIAPEDPRVVSARFDVALSEQDYVNAEALADEAARQNIDKANGAFFRARLLAAQGKNAGAIEALRQTLEAIPVFPQGNILLGNLLRERDLPEQAIEQYERALAYQPDSTTTLLALASTYQSVGRNEEALRVMRDAYQAAPNNTAVFNQYAAMERTIGDARRVLAARFEKAQRQPNDLANRRVLAAMLADEGRIDEARKIVDGLVEEQGMTRENVATKASVERSAGNVEAGLELITDYIASLGDQAQADDLLIEARYQRLVGNFDAMVRAYHGAIAVEDKTREQASREFGDVLFQIGRNDVALTVYRRLHESFPDEPTIRLRLAETLLRTGEAEEAEKLIAGADATATTGLLQVMAALQRGDADAALKLINQELSKIDDSQTRSRALLLLQRGEVLMNDKGDATGAIASLQEASDLDPTLAAARLMLAEALVASGDSAAATRELRDLLDQNNDDSRVRLRLVNLYLSDADFSGARSVLDQAIKDFPNEPVWPQIRARVAVSEQRPAEAEANWRKALELRPTAPVITALTNLLLDQDRTEDALAVLNGQSQIVGASPGLQALRGRALVGTGAERAGRQVFVRAIERSTGLGDMLQVADQVSRAYDNVDEAVAVFESVQTSYPAPQALAIAQIEITKQAFASALSRIDKALPSVPQDDEATRIAMMRLRGVCLYQTGKEAEARAVYESVLKIAENDTQTLNNYAFVLLEQGDDLKRALTLASRAARQAPSEGAILDTLGWAQFKNGDIEESRLTLQRAVTLGDLAASHYHLAVVLDALAKQTENATVRQSLSQRARASLERAAEKAEEENDQRYRDRAAALKAEWAGAGQEVTP